MPKKLTTQEFINKAQKVHGDKYDYHLVKYINAKTKVKIICPQHGVFEQLPNNHYKHGCSICAYNQKKYNQHSTEDFIKQAHIIHRNKYDYSLVDYKTAHTKVKIICPVHGVFQQKPNNHISQQNGCPLCYSNVLGLDLFIKKANIIHNKKYKYLVDKYIDNKQKIKIICTKHGIFEQKISSHLSGHGCPSCAYIRKKYNLNEFNDYKTKIRNKTKTIKKQLLINWDGRDYYDNEYIKDYYSLNHNDNKYPNIDHKISIFYGFINKISSDDIASIENLCITKKYHNLKKRTQTDIEYKKEYKKELKKYEKI